MYSATTRSIQVTVQPIFLDERSSPSDNHFMWAYRVKIENFGAEVIWLRARHWQITDGNGRQQEVRGAGVVGEQPELKPGETFEYTSGTPLNTPSGIMVGSYRVETAGGEQFDVTIPAFSLDSPHQRVQIH
ncbi:Protein ApaG [uncultured Gammaproteobacteria bacterium]